MVTLRIFPLTTRAPGIQAGCQFHDRHANRLRTNHSQGTNTSALIDRKVHTYTDGRLTATRRNGRLIYEAGYNPDGTLQWEEDESARRTEYTYNEMKRVYQRTIRGRGGDADQVITFDYDVLGNRTSETRTAGTLSVQSRWIYDLAGELTAAVGIDGLTNLISTSYTNGYKVVSETCDESRGSP